MTKTGKKFEIAVRAFVKRLDPDAQVLFNHKVSDRDTGKSRQCDVWINTKIGGHWPISILVSCKDHSRKLDVGHIGQFINEVRSTGASTGLIYSSSGFTKPAIEKAKSNGIACCLLFQNESVDIPEILWIHSYTCKVRVQLQLITDLSSSNLRTWNELFEKLSRKDNNEEKVIDILTMVYFDSEKIAVENVKGTGSFPKDWQNEITLYNINGNEEVKLRLLCKWIKYKALQEAKLVDGSYCVTDGSFVGSITGPPIDTQSEHPGEYWIEISDEEGLITKNISMMILYQGNMEEALRTSVGPKRI